MIEELKKLADAATPGPWHFVAERPRDYPGFGSEQHNEIGIATHVGDADVTAKYIAAANPAVVKKLLAVAEKVHSMKDAGWPITIGVSNALEALDASND